MGKRVVRTDYQPSRDADEAIKACQAEENRKQDQYLIHVAIVVPDCKEDLDEVNRGLETIRGVGSADCYDAKLLEPTDERRLKLS